MAAEASHLKTAAPASTDVMAEVDLRDALVRLLVQLRSPAAARSWWCALEQLTGAETARVILGCSEEPGQVRRLARAPAAP